jgi:hypothetical protein
MNCISAASNMKIIDGSLKNTFTNVCNFKVNVFGSDIAVEVIFDYDIENGQQYVVLVAYDKSVFDADSIVEIDDYINTNAIKEWDIYINEP